ncbi:hypothetical protein ACCC96_30395, partial [Pseudomonas sp. Pseusp11]|uniref:hypothetical protein n=1 Tax=Pseudomonas sp. Pseusp11 TaxID=3243003 RepID=UPI0039B3E1A9
SSFCQRLLMVMSGGVVWAKKKFIIIWLWFSYKLFFFEVNPLLTINYRRPLTGWVVFTGC